MLRTLLVVLAENKNQAWANYRYALTRLRENGDSIALLGGDSEERHARIGFHRRPSTLARDDDAVDPHHVAGTRACTRRNVDC